MIGGDAILPEGGLMLLEDEAWALLVWRVGHLHILGVLGWNNH